MALMDQCKRIARADQRDWPGKCKAHDTQPDHPRDGAVRRHPDRLRGSARRTLPPIARDLGITEGRAGQAISVAGLFAVVSSLMITGLVGRKRALGLFVLAKVVSGVIVTLAPNYPVLMAGRAWR